jgi:hypothetical protein
MFAAQISDADGIDAQRTLGRPNRSCHISSKQSGTANKRMVDGFGRHFGSGRDALPGGGVGGPRTALAISVTVLFPSGHTHPLQLADLVGQISDPCGAKAVANESSSGEVLGLGPGPQTAHKPDIVTTFKWRGSEAFRSPTYQVGLASHVLFGWENAR